MTYNKTQLTPQKEFERHIYHRDQFAHFMRWSYVLRMTKRFMNILDLGCGTGELLEVLYRNRRRPLFYCGLDVRAQTMTNNRIKFQKMIRNIKFAFLSTDLTSDFQVEPVRGSWDIITCLEVIEHIPRKRQKLLIESIKRHMNTSTIALISTPNYDSRKGAAKNHIINNEICERTYDEMVELIESSGLKIIKTFGTFADMSAIKKHSNTAMKYMYGELSKYHDVNLLSVLFAPMIPEHSRNVLYVCRRF